MNDVTVRKGRGCLFYGCLSLVVLTLVAIVGVFVGSRYLLHRMVREYTASAAAPIPRVEGTAAEAQAVQERFEGFTAALKSGEATRPLDLSERDLNLLVAYAPNLQRFHDCLYLTIESNTLKSQVSLPLESLGWAWLKGRYLNGNAELQPSVQNGTLVLHLRGLEVNGRKVPSEMLSFFRRQNLAENLARDPAHAEILRKLEDINVTDGRLRLNPRPAAP